MKKIIFSLLAVFFAYGCCTSYNIDKDSKGNITTFGSSFNLEHYVWESFLFPTNRTSGAQ